MSQGKCFHVPYLMHVFFIFKKMQFIYFSVWVFLSVIIVNDMNTLDCTNQEVPVWRQVPLGVFFLCVS